MFYDETVLTDILAIIMLVILYEIIRKVIKNKRKGGEMKMSNKLTRAEIYKIRYHIYRQAGYSALKQELRCKKIGYRGLEVNKWSSTFWK